MIAMLTSSTRRAVEDLHSAGRIKTMNGAKCGTLTDGTEFKVITREHELQGCRLSGYEIFGPVGRRLIDVAELNVR